jgi:hypothetical protein
MVELIVVDAEYTNEIGTEFCVFELMFMKVYFCFSLLFERSTLF